MSSAARRRGLDEHVGGVDRVRLGVDPGRAPGQDLVDAGQQLGRLAPARAAQQRDAVGARGERADRRAGEQHVAVVVEPDREDVGHAGTSRSMASVEVARAPGRGVDLLGAACARVGTSTASAPGGAGGLDVGADVADDDAGAAGRRRAARRRAGSGRARACGTRSRRRARAGSTRADRAGRAAPPSAHGWPRRPRARAARGRSRSGWRRPRSATPASRSRAERLARARHRLDPRRVAVVGDVGDQRPVAVEEHRRGAGHGRRPEAPASPRSHHAMAAKGISDARAEHRRDLARRARPGRDARPGELGGPGEPAGAEDGRRRSAARARGAGERAAAARGAARAASAVATSAPMPAAAVAKWRGRRPRGRRRARASRGRGAAHQHVVGVARLLGQRDPRAAPGARGARRGGAPATIRQPAAVTRRPRSASSR